MHASTAERNWLCRCFQFDTEWGSSTLRGHFAFVSVHSHFVLVCVYFAHECAWVCVGKIKGGTSVHMWVHDWIYLCMHAWGCVKLFFFFFFFYIKTQLSWNEAELFFSPSLSPFFSFLCGPQLQYSLTSDDLLVILLCRFSFRSHHFSPPLAGTPLKSKRQHNTVVVTSLFPL